LDFFFDHPGWQVVQTPMIMMRTWIKSLTRSSSGSSL